ncbi:MAG: ABC transporter permease [Thermodesulfobacteriota bacterium]|nr:ABC transporter permease [Thermodesulfobacteriota bacterium]
MKNFVFDLAVSVLAASFVALILLPMIALFCTISTDELMAQLRSPLVSSAIVISLQTSISVVLLALCLGVPVAYLLAMKDFRGKQMLDTLVALPISMPPLVAGLALLLLLGGHSPLGRLLNDYDMEVLFSKKGIILAQLFVSMPFLIKAAKEAFESIDKKLVKASLALGASQAHTFRKILLPLAGKGIGAGMVMTWARALGEFGATSMVAGCVPFKTETMTVAIYQNAMSGELTASIAVALLLAVFSFALLLAVKFRLGRPLLSS